MINEMNLNKYYQEFAKILISAIPNDWKKVLLFVEELGDSTTSDFIYYSGDNIGLGMEIPNDLNFSDSDKSAFYDKYINLISKTSKCLRNEFINSKEEPFISFAFYIDNNMQFEVKFGYEQPDYDMDDDRSYYGLGWALDSFGIEPVGDVDKKELQDYHEFIAKYKDKKIF